jgi:hypothetical protein
MRLILALAAGVLGYCYYRGKSARALRGSVREDVARWEGEGGNPVHAATAQPPADPMAPPFPAVDPAVRH